MKFVDEFKDYIIRDDKSREEYSDLRAIDISFASNLYYNTFSDMSYEDVSKNVAPVFKKYWFEYTVPKTIKIDNELDISAEKFGIQQVGVIFKSYNVKDIANALKIFNSFSPTEAEKSKLSEAKWIVSFLIFINHNIFGIEPIIKYDFLVFGNGRAAENFRYEILNGTSFHFINALQEIWKTNGIDESQKSIFFEGLFLRPILFANSLLHCKNIIQTEQQFTRPEKRESERRVKKKKEPLTKCYILDIEPLKNKARDSNGIDETNEQKQQRAYHICRGHFRDYFEKGLFGKHFGSYYIPDHFRGSKQNGEVDKDYRIRI